MSDMGHEIGLHFDPTLYGSNVEMSLKKEIDILSFAIQDTVQSISLHSPSIHGQYPLFKGYNNAYDPRMFSDENYISDSRFSFRGKDPFEFLKNIDNSMVQILLHPMHFAVAGGGYDEIFCESFIRHMNEVHRNFIVNSTYLDQVGDDFIAVLKRRL